MSVEEFVDEIDTDAIEGLVDRYESLSPHERDQRDEADARQQFINPLLRALGWDTTTDQVRPEQRTLVGDADYALTLNGREQFFIEAKRFSKSLDGTRRVRGTEQSFVEQAIDYAWHQGCDWAVLTNFAELRLYFTHVSKDRLEEGLIFSLSADEFTSEAGIQRLATLSKPAVRNGSLANLERTRQRDPVNVEILNVLSDARVRLTNDVHDAHPELPLAELRDGVQRILDRLVVMRVAEDRRVIPADSLRKMAETWRETTIDPDTRLLVSDLRNAFRDFDSVYNSELFAEHPCEEYEISNDLLEEIIDDLYEYTFSYLDADILGSIYEDYLGHAVEERGEELELVTQADERREGGIYYTPVPVVEYIVESTLGERLDEIMADVRAELTSDDPDFEAARRRFDEIEEITVLDVTCGSGSFLIKAYDLIVDCYEEFDALRKQANGGMGVGDYSAALSIPSDYETHILANNIYGVDLDHQATEIATVNLLLKALEKDEKLPTILGENIRRGNSLLNGSPEAVADVLGVDEATAAEMGAFDWQAEFEEVFAERGGFDVIVGNPPWGADTSGYEDWLERDDGYELAEGQYDSYELVMELAGELTAPDGTVGFVIPDSILREEHEQLRRLLTEEYELNQAHKLGEGVFDDVYTGVTIVQYTNAPPNGSNSVSCSVLRKEDRERMFGAGGEALATLVQQRANEKPQRRITEEPDYNFGVFASEEDYQLLDTIETETLDTDEILVDGRGDEIGKSGNVMRCPSCTRWDTYPRPRARSKGGGYYPKTCTHCGHEYEFEDALGTRSIIEDENPGDWKPIYFGEHVVRYRFDGSAYIDDSIGGIDLESESLYAPPKMLVRKTGFGFNANIDRTEGRTVQAVYVFRLRDDRHEPLDNYDLEYFLGLLCSRVMLYYFTKERSEIEWQSYPYKTQGLIMGLPFPAVDWADEEMVDTYEEFVDLVSRAVDSEGQIDSSTDYEIERLALDLYGIPEDNRQRIWDELAELQRLQVVRELFPDED